MIIRDKERQNMMIEWSILQEYKIILNMYRPDNRAAKYIKEKTDKANRKNRWRHFIVGVIKAQIPCFKLYQKCKEVKDVMELFLSFFIVKMYFEVFWETIMSFIRDRL